MQRASNGFSILGPRLGDSSARHSRQRHHARPHVAPAAPPPSTFHIAVGLPVPVAPANRKCRLARLAARGGRWGKLPLTKLSRGRGNEPHEELDSQRGRGAVLLLFGSMSAKR